MDVRSDFALQLQLEETLGQAVDDGLRAAVAAVLAHMSSGGSRNRRGGRALVAFLEKARDEAARAEEWQVVKLLLDSLDYAEGRILKPDFEERYRLFQDGARSDTDRRYLADMMRASFIYVLDVGHEFVAHRPDAGVDQLMGHLAAMCDDFRFLDAPEDRPGRYRILRGRAETALWLERKLRNRIDVEDLDEAVRRIVVSPDALRILAADESGKAVLAAAELQRRSAGLATLRQIIEDPTASERDLQEALQGQHWIFGGRFSGETTLRRLVPGDEMDIPLIRSDGALHVVELKRATSLERGLIKRHRGAWVTSGAVHDAASQAVNYLVALDENRREIRERFGLETRRATATVLIGHPALHPEVPEEDVNEALRTFNTHMVRVEVRTYKDLVDSAERTLSVIE